MQNDEYYYFFGIVMEQTILHMIFSAVLKEQREKSNCALAQTIFSVAQIFMFIQKNLLHFRAKMWERVECSCCIS